MWTLPNQYIEIRIRLQFIKDVLVFPKLEISYETFSGLFFVLSPFDFFFFFSMLSFLLFLKIIFFILR